MRTVRANVGSRWSFTGPEPSARSETNTGDELTSEKTGPTTSIRINLRGTGMKVAGVRITGVGRRGEEVKHLLNSKR